MIVGHNRTLSGRNGKENCRIGEKNIFELRRAELALIFFHCKYFLSLDIERRKIEKGKRQAAKFGTVTNLNASGKSRVKNEEHS